MPPRTLTSQEEIARLAALMPVADPNKDNGAFVSLTNKDVVDWLNLLGVREMDPNMRDVKNAREQREKGIKKLRLALWDVQRLDLLFPGYLYSESPNFKLSRFPSWPNWQDAHPELKSSSGGAVKYDGYADAARFNSYIMTHFTTLAFTQAENAQDIPANPPNDIKGAWIGTKKIMSHASLDITREGGKDTPFVVYFSTDKGPGTSMLTMEILDVKQVSWPEPGPKFLAQLKMTQEIKYGDPATGPLNPMMQTPKIPVVVVRYSYLEGRPKGGSQFMLHLESRLEDILPPGTSAAEVRKEFEYHLQCGEEMPEAHIRMFARLLSYNSELVDREWMDDLQGHWFLSKEVEKETRISFFVPCPRLRFRALEEIETGKPAEPLKKCSLCGKDGSKSICGSCKAVCYCSTECSKNNWSKHKTVCKLSRKLLNDPSSLPHNKLYIPARGYVQWVLNFGFANEQETLKMGGSTVDEPSRNEYGDERFMCRAMMPRAGKATWDPEKAKMIQYGEGGGTVFIYDRRRSVLVRLGPIEQREAKDHGVIIPFHEEGYKRFAKVIAEKGHSGQVLYVWTKRVGDCLEIELEDLPNQDKLRWE